MIQEAQHQSSEEGIKGKDEVAIMVSIPSVSILLVDLY